MSHPRARQLCVIPLFAVAIALIVSLALPSIARAQCPMTTGVQESVCNIGQPRTDADDFSFYDDHRSGQDAFSFTTGTTGDAYTLDSVSIYYNVSENGTNVLAIHTQESGVPSANPINDADGNPTALTTTDSGDTVRTFTSSSAITLLGDTTYYIVPTTTDIPGPNGRYRGTTATTHDGPNGWSINGRQMRSGGSWGTDIMKPAQFAVVATPAVGDNVVLAVAADKAEVTEGTDSSISFTLSFLGTNTFTAQQEITVRLTGRTGYVADADHPKVAIFNANSTDPQTVTFPLIDDNTDLGGTIVATSIANGEGYIISGAASVTIIDDDFMAVTGCATTSGSQEHICTLGEADQGTFNVTPTEGHYQSFTTGPAAGGYIVNSVRLRLAEFENNPEGFRVSIQKHDDMANRPEDGNSENAGIGTLTLVGALERAGIREFTASGVELEPSTRYHLVSHTTQSGRVRIGGTASNTEADASTDWSLTGRGFYNGNTDTWDLDDAIPISGYRGRAHHFGIVATPAGAPSSDATLSALTLSSGTLLPAFDPAVLTYTASVENSVTRVTVTGTPNDDGAIAEITTISLDVGENIVTTTVTAADGVMTMTYTVTIIRMTSSDTTLDTLSLSGITLTPPFTAGSATTAYTASVANSVSTTKLQAFPTHSRAIADVRVTGGSSGDISPSGLEINLLEGGDTVITVTVIAEDNSRQAYTITVTRAAPPPTTPPAPTGVTATAGDAGITVTWTAGTGVSGQPAAEHHQACAILATATNFPLNHASCEAFAEEDAPATAAILTGLTNGTTYKVAVRWFDFGDGTSGDWIEATGTVTPTACPSVSSGQEWVCNFDVISTGGSGVGTFSAAGGGVNWRGNTFTTGTAANGYTLDSVTFSVRGITGSPGALRVAIHEEASGGGPEATAHGTLSGSVSATGMQTYTASGITLAANIPYFVLFTTPAAAGDNAYSISRTTMGTDTGTASWSIGDRHWLSFGTTTYTEESGGGSDSFAIAVLATPVATPSSDATLSALVLSGVTLDTTFAPATQTYTASVANDVSSTTITYTLSDSDASAAVTQDGTALSGDFTAGVAANLNVGANQFVITVTAEDTMTTQTYTVTVTREAPPLTTQPPTNVAATATATAGELTVTWTAPTADRMPTGYQICAYATSAGSTFAESSCTSENQHTPSSAEVSNGSATLTGLTGGTPYWVAVRGIHASGNSTWAQATAQATPTDTAAAPVTTQPPTNVTVAATATAGELTVTWTAPTAARVPTGYQICAYATSAGSTFDDANCTSGNQHTPSSAEVSNGSATLTGLTGGTPYWVAVRGIHASGNSDWTTAAAQATPTTAAAVPPPAPTIGTVTAGNANIVVNWTAGTGTPAATGHSVCAILSSETDFPDDVTSCAAHAATVIVPTAVATLTTGLTNGMTYKIAVRSYHATAVSAWVEAIGTFTPSAALRLKLRVFLESALP